MSILAVFMHRRIIVLKSVFLLMLLAASLSFSRAAWAQATANFDLACRSLLTSGGGVQTAPSGSTATIASFAQWTQGISQSTNYQVRTGFIQPRPLGTQSAARAMLSAASERFLPIVRDTPFVVRACQY